VPALDQIVTHIEPTGEQVARRQATEADEAEVRRALATRLEETGIDCRPHAITIRRDGDELALTFHCIADPNASITDAHDLSVQVESFLRKEIPGLGRVIIHMEPDGA